MPRRKIKHNSENSLNGLLFEPTGTWRPPGEFPNLTGVKVIGFDFESKDPNLNSRGPGFIRGDAETVGFSLATEDEAWYFPYGHMSGGNMDKDVCVRYLRDVMADPDRLVVAANAQYELEGAWSLGVDIKGKIFDVQIAEAIIDEERDDGYDLGTLSRNYLGLGKDEALLNEAASAYGVDPKSGMWKLHSKYVGAYGERDALATIQIFEKQKLRLKSDDLEDIFDLESRLLPILWKMRLQGIPVDLERAKNLSEELKKKEDESRNYLKGLVGFHVDEWSGKHLEAICKKHDLYYPRTEKGNPSFTGDFLEESLSPILQVVASIRELNRMRSTFVDDWVFKNQIGGSIHPQWKQLKSDEGGTRTGRMAASNPNPQQVPSRNDIAPLIRAIFRRTQVDGTTPPWAKLDYSQQEPRLMVHYAYLCGYNGAADFRDQYLKDPTMRIYKVLAKAAGVPDREAKDLTLGRMYGMGLGKMAEKCNCSKEQAKEYLDKLDAAVPFVKQIAEDCMRKADQRGWIKTLCGRKRHFNYWEPVDSYDLKGRGIDTLPVGSVKLAESKWPGSQMRRAYTHKALNALIQGSAADMTKSAIVKGYEQQGRIPYMAVHDELDGPVVDKPDAERWKTLAETCVDCKVPIVAELHYGESWK